MSDVRKGVECDFCGADYHIKYSEDHDGKPQFCSFCGESFYNAEELEDEDDDGDLDYVDDDRDETEEYN